MLLYILKLRHEDVELVLIAIPEKIIFTTGDCMDTGNTIPGKESVDRVWNKRSRVMH